MWAAVVSEVGISLDSPLRLSISPPNRRLPTLAGNPGGGRARPAGGRQASGREPFFLRDLENQLNETIKNRSGALR